MVLLYTNNVYYIIYLLLLLPHGHVGAGTSALGCKELQSERPRVSPH